MRNLLWKHKKQISIVIMLIIITLWVPTAKAARPRAKFPVQKMEQELGETGEDLPPENTEKESENVPTGDTLAESDPVPAPAPETPPQEPTEGRMTASASVRSSLATGGKLQGSLPAKEGDQVSVHFTLTNTGDTPLTDVKFYTIVPAGVSVQSVSSNGTVGFLQGLPPSLGSITTIQGGSADQTNATAFYIEFANRTLQSGDSTSVEVVFQLQQGNSNLSLAGHDFAYLAKDSTGSFLPVATGKSIGYSTDAYYLEYIKPTSYQAITGIPAMSAGLFDATGTKNLVISSQKPTMVGQMFSHWNTQADGLGASYDPGATILLTRGNAGNGVALFPIWRANSYTVTFNPANGETILPATYLEGTTITEPVVTRLGYALDGWYRDVNTKWNFSTDVMPSQNITLTARWTLLPVQQFRVSFLPEGGNVTPAFRDVAVGALINPPVATRAGYQLKHWLTPTNTVWDFSTHTMGTGNLILKAVWEEDKTYEYTVTYDPNGGSVTPSTGKYLVGSKLVPPAIHREFYIFEGWKTAAGTIWNFAIDTMPNQDMKLTAQWKFDVVSARLPVSFETGAGSMVPAVQYIQFGAPISKPMDPRKVDYTFTGWRRQGDTKDWDFATLLREEHFARPFVFVAQWQKNSTREVTVYFHPQGGSPTPQYQKVMPGGFVEAPASVSRNGYSLLGWYTGPNLSYEKWDFDTKKVPADNANLMLYAYWISDDNRGSSRPDTGPNIPGRNRLDRKEIMTGSGVEGAGPPEISEVIVGGTSTKPPTGPVTVGQNKPVATRPPAEVNPSTGGLETTEPKQNAPVAVIQQVKESTTQIKEKFVEMTANASAKELNMLWIALFMGIAAFIFFILGIIKRGRR